MPRKPRKVDPERLKCRILLARSVSKEEAAQQTGLDMRTVGSILGWVRGPSGKAWIKKNEVTVFPTGRPVTAPPVPAPQVPGAPAVGSAVGEGDGGKSPAPGEGIQQGPTALAGGRAGATQPGTEPPLPNPVPLLPGEMTIQFQREMWTRATPLVRKVALNPKTYFYYDYSASTYPQSLQFHLIGICTLSSLINSPKGFLIFGSLPMAPSHRTPCPVCFCPQSPRG